jgi:cell division protein FtsB
METGHIRSRQGRAPGSRSQMNYLPAATRVVAVLIVTCTLLTVGFAFYPEWTRLADMKRDLAQEKDRLAELQKQARDRDLEVHLLQTDPEYLAIYAREKLDMMKDGETIFRLSQAHPKHY